MAKFLTLAEAAQFLGVTTEDVNEMRLRQELHGYRDGTSWKFKPEEIEQAAQRRLARDESSEALHVTDAEHPEESALEISVDDIDIDIEDTGDLVLSEFELGDSGPSTSNTIIGDPGQRLSPDDSDVRIISTAEGSESGASNTMIGRPGLALDPGASAIKLEMPRGGDSGASNTMIGAPGVPLDAGESAIKLHEQSFEDSPSSTVIGRPGDVLSPDESRVRLNAFDDDLPDLDLLERDAVDDAADSGVDLVIASDEPELDIAEPSEPSVTLDSGITLADENSDDDFVLGGPGSDVTISPGDSGISLTDPSDSGLSLDAPLELRAASEDPAFEIAESSEDMGGAADFDSDEVMDLKTDDDFQLTPMATEGEESSDDSGSQVIAIDAESPFDSAGSSMFGSADGLTGDLLEADSGSTAGPLGGGGLGAPAPALAGAISSVPAMAAAEQPYPVWVVLLMAFCVLFLALSGMMMYDLVRNMWSWSAPYKVNSSIMDMVLGLFGK